MDRALKSNNRMLLESAVQLRGGGGREQSLSEREAFFATIQASRRLFLIYGHLDEWLSLVFLVVPVAYTCECIRERPS